MTDQTTPDFQPWLREALRCPVTGTPLREDTAPDGGPELHNTSPDQPLAYPVRAGVPVLLAQEARSRTAG